MTAQALTLRHATLGDGRRADVRLVDGRVSLVAGAGTLAVPPSDEVHDLTGYLLLPAMVEPHAHLDKAFTADQVRNPGGDLYGAVVAWLAHRPTMTSEDIRDRARQAIWAYVGNGVTAIRSHVDIGADLGLRALEAVNAVRAEVAGHCDVQLAAFAATPLTGPAGAKNRELLRQALAEGADVLGACPGLDPDPAGCVDVCLELGGEADAPLDLHIDEQLEPQPCTLELLADAVGAAGYQKSVVASHAVSLGMMPPAEARRIADKVAAAGIAVACLPQTNLYLQGRQHGHAVPRGLTALATLQAAGVTVIAGGDNLQDPFHLLGRADPLETAALLVLAGHDSPELAYTRVSSTARSVLGLAAAAVSPGAAADLVAIRATSIRQAVAQADAQRLVIHAGRVVASTTVRRHHAGTRLEQ